jgi:tetratricopeptide (TPR) repeat protein
LAIEVTPRYDAREADEILLVTSAVEEGPQLRSRWRFWIPRLGAAILIPVLLLALTEGALRLFHVGYSTSLMEPCVVHGQPTSCYNLFFAAPFFPPGIIKTPQFFSMSPQKPPGTYRIVVLGESAAMGDPDPAYGFSRCLEVMLRQRFPSTKFEVINTSMVAINSHVLLPIARELVNYKPDLYIIYGGSNEVVGPYGPGTVLTASSMSMPVIRSSIFVRSSRLGQLLTSVGSSRSEWRGMEMFLNKEVSADSPRLTPAYRNFQINLHNMVEAAHVAGARVILSTVATNLRDCAPFASLHRAGLSSDARHNWSSLLQQGVAFENAGAFEEALKLYSSASSIDDQFAELQFRIGHCYWSLGNFRAAKEHYVRARDLDALRFRADSHINDEIRSVGTSLGARVDLLDADSLFASESHNGVIGSEFFYDHVHFTPAGNYLLAKAIFEHVVNDSSFAIDSGSRGTSPPSELECERMLALTGRDRSRVAAEMVNRLQRPPFTIQLNHVDQIQSFLFRSTGVTESVQDTVSQYQWALSQFPDDLILHHKFGLFLFNYDRDAAAEQLMLGRPTDDFPIFMPDGSPIQ